MKVSHKIGIFLVSFAVAVGAGVIGLRNNDKAIKAEAIDYVNNVGLVYANDATCTSTRWYQRSGSDLTSLPWSTLSTTDSGGFTIPGPSQTGITVAESSANKNYNYVFYPFFIYPYEQDQIGMNASSKYTLSITFNLSLTKTASGGGAYAFAELMFFGATNKPTPSVPAAGFDTNQSRTGSSATTYSNVSGSIGCYTDRTNTAITTSTTKTITLENDSSSYGVARYQLGLFVGCNYASSYTHTTSATVTCTLNSVTKTDLVAKVDGNTNYSTFSEAVDNATSTIKLLRDTNSGSNNATTINRNLTIDLNGFNFSKYGTSSVLTIGVSKTVTIQNGTLSANFNNDYTTPIVSLSQSATLNLSGVTVNKINGTAAAIKMSSGSQLNINSSTTISVNSSSNKAYAIDGYGNISINGGTVTSTTAPAIYLTGTCSVSVASGSTIRSTGSYAIAGAKDNYSKIIVLTGSLTLASGATAKIGLPCNTGSYINASGLTTSVTVNVTDGYFANNTTIVTNDSNKRVSISSVAATGHSYVRDGDNIVYKLNTYAVRFYPNGGSGTTQTVNREYGTSYTIPHANNFNFVAPAYHSFKNWNTASDGNGTTYNSGASYNIVSAIDLYAVWTQTDDDIVDQFVGVQLHFDVDVIDTSNVSDTGACRGENGYYQVARAVYVAMNNLQKYKFSNNAQYENARARFSAWAAANGESINYQNYTITQNSNAKGINDIAQESINGHLVFAIIGTAVLTLSLAGLYIFSKKKRN